MDSKIIIRIAKNTENGGIGIIAIFLILISSCNKLVQIPNPINTISGAQAFSSDALATSTMLGIYSYMSSNNTTFTSVSTTLWTGLSADELIDGNTGDRFQYNTLTAQINSNNQPLGYFWQPAYYIIYSANAVISGVQSSTTLTASTQRQLTGEAKFIRAFCYFYLTNIFGEVPLVLTTDFNKTVLLSKSSKEQIFQQIVADLRDAQNLMIGDFSLTGGQPIRANKWAATALLARVYLYEQNWKGADSAATAVINSGIFRLLPKDSINQVFLANSAEAILQIQTVNNFPYATQEGNTFVPSDNTSSVSYWLTPQLINSFEPNDLRRTTWVDSTFFNNVYYYYPFKYEVKSSSQGNITENYNLLRLAEQYLIRAEAEATGEGAGLNGAISDLNAIRGRAGLNPYAGATDSVVGAIQHENQTEFFCEMGHRWFDLKRWGIAVQTLASIPYKTGNIDSIQLLYPIPLSEMQADPNLTQNQGY